jgi:hypothetical protein
MFFSGHVGFPGMDSTLSINSAAPEKVARNQSPERQKCIQWLRNEAWGS